MGGVDQGYQEVDQYAGELKTLKLWRKVVLHLIDRCLNNAYHCYVANAQNPNDHYNFLVSVVESLIGEYHQPKKRPGRVPVTPLQRLTERHFLDEVPDKKRRDCAVCSARGHGMRKRTSSMCVDCGVGLCTMPCFRIWHSEFGIHRGVSRIQLHVNIQITYIIPA
jgi:hypothetical protein